MNYPLPGLTVKIKTEQETSYLNFYDSRVETSTTIKPVSNYEYEVENNEDKRKILILKREYLPAIIGDMRNIMKYNKSSQYIDKKTKRGFNPNTSI
jgi:hypothetical protein